MTRLGWLLVAGAGALLAATVGLDATAPVDDGAPRADFVPPNRAPAPVAPAAEPARVDETDAQVATILERPLFSRDRRPTSAAVVAAQADAPLPRLTGIVIGPDGARAFFAPTNGGRAKVVAVGESLGPYRVTSIDAKGVRVEGPGEPRTLVLAFGPQAIPADPAQPAAEGAAPPNGLSPQQYDLNARQRPLSPGRGIRPFGNYPGLPSLGGPPPGPPTGPPPGPPGPPPGPPTGPPTGPPPPGESGLPEPQQGGQLPDPGPARNADSTAG